VLGDFSYLGIDPGAKGGMALITGSDYSVWNLPETPSDQLALLVDTVLPLCESLGTIPVTMIEQIGYLPKIMPPTSIVKLARSYGVLLGLLTGRVAYREIPPSRWQKALKCQTGGDKKVTYAMAQRLYPHVKITHNVADAILIARYCSLHWT
jgi:Holliday junction resolvasome RuvABC endonuclease subunit